MNSSLSKYHQRAARYILQPQDNTLIRVAGPQQTPWEEATEIQNISLTGLGFTAPTELCPLVGELIKIQFQVPGSAQMACFGLVTRIEPQGPSTMLVGVQFKKLELPHRIILAQALANKLREQQKEQEAKKSDFKQIWKQKWPQIALAFMALSLWLLLFYVFSVILSKT
jgi:hypothetical protein